METVKARKAKSHAFGKDIYYLGKLDGRKMWLEEATWDFGIKPYSVFDDNLFIDYDSLKPLATVSGWYWGFGYIETYTNNNNPANSKDIESHQHYNSLLLHDGIHILSDIPELTDCPLTISEQWELSDLMKSFYTLRSAAETFHLGNSNMCVKHKLDLKDDDFARKINDEILPKIFDRIYEILSPTV